TTESGAYELGGVTYPDNFSVTRNPDAVWFLPSENEWYKAAYYDPRTQAEGGPGGNDHYWFYPTMSDEVPAQSQTGEDGAVSNAGPNVANYDYGSQWNGFYGQTHVVGTAGSTSYYGLFDMGGNVWEYNESIIVDPRRDPTASFRGARGACWDDPHWLMSGDRRGYAGIENCGTVWQCFNEAQGFRMATIPTEREKGDFDYDWNLDAHDIDLLTKEIRSGENAVQMDLNGDRLVNLDDRTVWVEKLAGSEFGDSNLDGSFDSSDLVQVFQFGEYEDTKQFNSTWATGDWNGDGDFSSADIVHAFMNASYSGAKVSAVQAVPEPQSYVPITFAALFFVFNRRRVCIV
ncbi:MAG: SUMF1/EgtB/PvdO family nonheme iron enzyme, partial [Planctomycetales bacterium]|nr:SUMF1/EgtB/PvdO family nonheme iron enzyme [Planctomycetales bacterium]